MKKLAIAAVAVSMASTPAFAASQDVQDVVINAAVAPECSMENPADINLGNLIIDEDAGPNALKIKASTTSAVQNIWVSCNYVTQFTIKSDNKYLKSTTPVNDPQFTNQIVYGLQFEPSVANPGAFIGSFSHKPNFQANPRVFAQTKEFHDQARLSVTVEPGNGNQNKRPVAGSYTDTITITLGTL